jgi:hypothetical protein
MIHREEYLLLNELSIKGKIYKYYIWSKLINFFSIYLFLWSKILIWNKNSVRQSYLYIVNKNPEFWNKI